MLYLFEYLVHLVISCLTTLNHGLVKHLNIMDRLMVGHLKVPSVSQFICVDFTETRSLQQWKSKDCLLHNRC
jgi:hypothetical protein